MSVTILISLAAVALFTAYMFVSYKRMKNAPEVATHEKIVNLTDADFEKKISEGVWMVDFWAAWCMPCKMMAPVINEVAEESGNQATIGKLDVDAFPEIAKSYSVRGIPTLILFRNGLEIKRFVGAKTKTALLAEIRNAL